MKRAINTRLNLRILDAIFIAFPQIQSYVIAFHSFSGSSVSLFSAIDKAARSH
jgi:hypothetical protein